jgi:hypothetical protein
MAKTITQILSYVDTKLPNKLATSDKIVLLSDILGDGDFKEYDTTLVYQSTYTSTGSSNTYNLPSGVKIKDIYWLGITNSTYNSTNLLSSTTLWNEYKYAGIEDVKEGNRYYSYTSQISLSPPPTDVYHLRIIHKPHYGPYTASSDSTTVIAADNPLIKYAQFKLCAEVCKHGSFPRIDLGNNFEMSAREALEEAQLHFYNSRRAESKRNISWKRWW